MNISHPRSIRRFLLITLSHTESRNLSKEDAYKRLADAFECHSIVVAQEQHQTLGSHYHIGVFNNNASKYTATNIIRKLFPEFPGMQCVVKFHKGWGTICTYILKEDPNPMVWGDYSLQEIQRIGIQKKQKIKLSLNTIHNAELVEKLRKCEDWIHVYKDPFIVDKLLHRYNNLRRVYDDLQVLNAMQTLPIQRIVDFLRKQNWPSPYQPEELKEKFTLINWIASQLVLTRPIKTKQLFLYGPPSSQKTLFIDFLSNVLRIYFASNRTNDFSGADDFYDLWVFDEFYEISENASFISQADILHAKTLLKVLDGQQCKLDAKYGTVFHKRRNIPIIMISNEITHGIRDTQGPMRARFNLLQFDKALPDLELARIVSTLWECFLQNAYEYYLEPEEEIQSEPIPPEEEIQSEPIPPEPEEEIQSEPIPPQEEIAPEPILLLDEIQPEPEIPAKELQSEPEIPAKELQSEPEIPAKELQSEPEIPAKKWQQEKVIKEKYIAQKFKEMEQYYYASQEIEIDRFFDNQILLARKREEKKQEENKRKFYSGWGRTRRDW